MGKLSKQDTKHQTMKVKVKKSILARRKWKERLSWKSISSRQSLQMVTFLNLQMVYMNGHVKDNERRKTGKGDKCLMEKEI